MNKQDIRNEGYRHGWNVASWTDLPEIGWRIPRHLDWVGYGTVTAENQADVWELLATATAETHDAESTPAIAAAGEGKPYDVWDVFDNGRTAGIRAYWRKHLKGRNAA